MARSYYLAPSLVALRDEVNRRWPNRSKASDGWIGDLAHQARGSRSEHNPDSEGVVRAIDITARGIDTQALLDAVIGDSRVHYAIFNRRIYSRAYGWKPRPYSGRNPHTLHVHVSIRNATSEKASLDVRRKAAQNTSPWGLLTTAKPVTPPKPVPTPTPDIDPLEEIIMAMYDGKADFEKRLGDIIYSKLGEFTEHNVSREVGRAEQGARQALERPTAKGRSDEWGASVLDGAARGAFRAGAGLELMRQNLAIVKELADREGVDVDESAIAHELAASLAPELREIVADEVGDEVAERVVAKLGKAITEGAQD